MKKLVLYSLSLALSITVIAQTPIKVDTASATVHGPENGSLLIIGGNVGNTPAIWNKFVELAGGKDKARIVVISAATGDSAAYRNDEVEQIKKYTGIKAVTLLHATSIAEANSEKFVAPIKQATGVYFLGGRQWRIADYYLNTLTHQAFYEVLKRGGVIAGSSAGASIQGSFLWRGDTHNARILVGDHTQGLGFLKNSIIDQHLLRRNRQFDLVDAVKQAPQLIGLGLDEATAVLVQKDILEVIGKSYVAVYDYNTVIGKGKQHVDGIKEDYTASSGPFFFLGENQKYDLKNRAVIKPAARSTETAGGQ